MLNIEDLTLRQVREIQALAGKPAAADPGFPIGKPFMIRTVTHIVTGRLKAVIPTEFVLTEAAWIADTGRYAGAVATANFSEVEPYPDGPVFVGRGALIDATEIPSLPRVQK
jgi:hypothetical protein